MSETARVDSIDDLRAFRVSLLKFAEACNVALGDAEAEMAKVGTWLERDQISFWNGQIQKRHEIVERSKEAVRMKKLFKSPTGSTQSSIEEEKALRVAVRNLEEAHMKLAATKQWSRRMQKEIMLYKGGVTRFLGTLAGDIPRAVAWLDGMVTSLDAYASLTSGSAGGSTGGTAGESRYAADAGASMSRGDGIIEGGLISIATLRENTPPPEVRAVAPPAEEFREEPWLLPPLSADALKAIRDLNFAGPAMNPDETLVLGSGATIGSRIYLDHRPPAGPGDSGWFIGSAERIGIVALRSVRSTDFFESRPDFRELLHLPEGYLVVLDDQGVRSIFSPTGEDEWANLMQKSE